MAPWLNHLSTVGADVVIQSKASTNGHTRERAGIDDLTGTWNRAGFIAAATPMFLSCQRREAPVSLAFFEFHTDAGYAADPKTVEQILVGMGELMRKAFRASDVVGRVDPRRFVVLLADCTDEALAAIDGVRALDRRRPRRNGSRSPREWSAARRAKHSRTCCARRKRGPWSSSPAAEPPTAADAATGLAARKLRW